MLKRMIAMMLSLLMLVTVLPMVASAETEEELCTRIAEDYQKALEETGEETLGGYCGLLASCQMYFSGINAYFVSMDGNKHFDTYSQQTVTTGGFRPKAYSAEEYTLEQALNEITKKGKQDAYNMVVGFEWTNTEAGNIYGHAVFVYAILDGIVYFTEGFDTSMGTKEGEAIQATISEFARYYHDWTVFEGIVVFGQKGYETSCRRYAADMFVEATVPEQLMSQPCSADSGETESVALRQVQQDERLLVSGLIENKQGQYYYRVDDGKEDGYIPAQSVIPLRFNYERISLIDTVLPQVLEHGKPFSPGGGISAERGAVKSLRVEITDINDRVVLSAGMDSSGGRLDLRNRKLNESLSFGKLDKGYYSFNVYAQGVNHYVHNGKIVEDTQELCLLSHPFRVGKNLPDYAKAPSQQPESRQEKDGWYWEQDNWHYYEDGAPKTGWFTYKSVQYYLQPDGGVTTGMATVENEQYIFTHTGAMRTGWLDIADGTCYLLPDGKMAKGWQTIEGKKYFFDPKGILLAGCWFSQSKELYYLRSDGSAAVGWVKLPEGYFCFSADGKLKMPNLVKDLFNIEPEYA